MREIITTVGTLVEHGKAANWGEYCVYSFLELKGDDDSISRINNATVANECQRGIHLGDKIAIVHAYTPNGVSASFPSVKGMSICYAIANTRLDREFNDIEQLVNLGNKLRGIVSLSRWTLVLVCLSVALYSLIAGGFTYALIALAMSSVIAGGLYLMNISRFADQAPLYATDEEVRTQARDLHSHLIMRTT